jgi:hypothetical protein
MSQRARSTLAAHLPRQNWALILHDLKHKDVSQAELAQRTGISRATICRMGQGTEPAHAVGLAILAIHQAEGCDHRPLIYPAKKWNP